MDWITTHGGSYAGIPSHTDIEKLSGIAADCMKAYNPRPGDRELVGWFLFGDVQGGSGARYADGICLIGSDGRAAIGINLSVLNMDPTYARAVVGLHELAHLSVDEHNDEFSCVLMGLQHKYFHSGKYTRADSTNLPQALTGRRITGL